MTGNSKEAWHKAKGKTGARKGKYGVGVFGGVVGKQNTLKITT